MSNNQFSELNLCVLYGHHPRVRCCCQTAVITHLSNAGEAAVRVMAYNNKPIIPAVVLAKQYTLLVTTPFKCLLRFVVFSSLFNIYV